MAFTASTYRAIPGSLSLDNTLAPKLDTNVGERFHIYQPPNTPSASSLLHQSTASLISDAGDDKICRSRKRLRRDSAAFGRATTYSATANGWTDLASGQSSASLTPGNTSPAPLVNTRYILAGGLDTPTAAAASTFDPEDSGYSQSRIAYRRGRSGAGYHRASQQDGYFPYTPAPLSRESNGRSRVYVSPTAHDGWGKAVFDVLGGVAEKVWDFCTASAFRGFYAGGGRSYQMRQPYQTLREEQSIWQDVEERDESFRGDGRGSTLIPGQFPDEDFIPDYMSRGHNTSPRPAKKIQRIKGEGELRASWVLVSSTPSSRERSPFRIAARKVPTASSPERRPATASARPVTSKAGRRPILPASRPSLTSLAGSPVLHPSRPASFASPRSPGATPIKSGKVLSPEAKLYAAKVRKRELEDDASIKRFNQQLKAMIKEGKEALGTKVEVDDEVGGMVDKGYAEGEYFATKTPW